MKLLFIVLSIFSMQVFAQGESSSEFCDNARNEVYSELQGKCVIRQRLCPARPCDADEVKDVDCKCISKKKPEAQSCIPGVNGCGVVCTDGMVYSLLQKQCVKPQKICTMQMCPQGMEKDIDCKCVKFDGIVEGISVAGAGGGEIVECPKGQTYSSLQSKCVVPAKVCTMQMCPQGKVKDIDCKCVEPKGGYVGGIYGGTPVLVLPPEFEGCTRSADRESITCPDGLYKKVQSTVDNDRGWPTDSIENQGNKRPTQQSINR